MILPARKQLQPVLIDNIGFRVMRVVRVIIKVLVFSWLESGTVIIMQKVNISLCAVIILILLSRVNKTTHLLPVYFPEFKINWRRVFQQHLSIEKERASVIFIQDHPLSLFITGGS